MNKECGKMSKPRKRAMLMLIAAVLALSVLPVFPAHAAITVDPLVDNDGVYGDTITVTGTEVTAGSTVNLYWDSVSAWDGEKGLLNSTEGEAAGTFSVNFDVPEAVNDDHYLWVKDLETGQTDVSEAFYVSASIELDPESGLEDDKVTINGYGFADEEDIEYVYFDEYGVVYMPIEVETTPATPETDELGSWEATFKVPDMGGVYSPNYVVRAESETLWAEATFNLGASISFDEEEGPVGTIVEVKGRGFDPTEFIGDDPDEVTLYDEFDLVTIPCYILDDDPIDVEADGEFSMDIVIPQVSEKKEKYVITVTDSVETATAKFNVTALAKISVEPEYGVQGAKINIEGSNFIQKSGEDVVVDLYNTWPGTYQSDIKEFETDSNGEFSGTFTVPAVSSDNYKVVAYQTDYSIDDDASFRVGMIIVILSKTSGPSGTKVTMTGTGFTAGSDNWNATFGDLTLFDTGDVDPDGDLAGPPIFFVPSVDPATYTIMLLDIEEEIEVEVEFTVTEKTTVTTDPLVAPNEYNVSIEGKYFAEEEGKDIDEIVLYNVTADGEIDEDWDITSDVDSDTPGDIEMDEDGNFTAFWVVYDDDVLSLGDYWLNVTDEEGMFAQYMLTIVAKTVDIDPRKASFAVGDTVAFNIESSFAKYDSYIEVMTPDGDLYWTTDDFTEVPPVWIKVGTIMRVPYYEQTAGGNPMTLIDVPLGTWSWTWYDEDDDEIDSGTFTVTEAPADILAQQLQTLTEDFAGLSEDFAGLSQDVTGLSTNVAALSADVSAAAAAAQAANNAVNNLAQTVGDIAQTAVSAKTAADAAKTAADAAKTSADDARTAASGLTTLVYGAIGASLVAALAAIVSLMQISRRIAG